MPETLCPRCGHTPIPAGAEACPSCHEPFAFLPSHKRKHLRLVDGRTVAPQGEATEYGGNITSVLTAHPREPAAVLGAGALLWLLRGLPLGAAGDASPWGLVVAVLGAGAIVLMFTRFGPARRLAQLAAAAQLGAALWCLWRQGLTLWTLVPLLHAGVAVSMGVGQMGDLRRVRSFLAGLALAAVALVLLVIRAGQIPPERLLVDDALGLELALPEGLRALPREALVNHLMAPPESGTSAALGFGNPARGVYGLLTADREEGSSLLSGCQALRRTLGAVDDPRPLAHPAPRALGKESIVYPLRTRAGSAGLIGCGRLEDGRLVGFCVLDGVGNQPRAEALFDRVGEGLRLQ